ncbi:hypothetical protein BU17DRAFT_28019, partial [Hysterangium stoloniferum]
PVIFKDKIGSGSLMHLQVKKGDGTFWTEQVFCHELNHLDRHLGIHDDFDILGHS